MFPYLYRFQSRETRCKSSLLPRRVLQLKLVKEMSNADSEIIKMTYAPGVRISRSFSSSTPLSRGLLTPKFA